jgi:hypothetical protein
MERAAEEGSGGMRDAGKRGPTRDMWGRRGVTRHVVRRARLPWMNIVFFSFLALAMLGFLLDRGGPGCDKKKFEVTFAK